MPESNAEQRRFPRFQYSIPIKYHIVNNPIPTYTVTRDVSIGGLKILTNNFIPRDTEININVELPPANPIDARVRVIWSNRIDHSDQYLSGTRFSELNETDKKNISDLVSYALKH